MSGFVGEIMCFSFMSNVIRDAATLEKSLIFSWAAVILKVKGDFRLSGLFLVFVVKYEF